MYPYRLWQQATVKAYIEARLAIGRRAGAGCYRTVGTLRPLRSLFSVEPAKAKLFEAADLLGESKPKQNGRRGGDALECSKRADS